MAWYKEWFGTRYYKLLYGHRDDADGRAWAEMIADKAGLKTGDELLDMGCGRGRHARWFAAKGVRVTGIDLSAESIADARAEVPDVRFEVHDMKEVFARDRFDVVVCLFTSLGYSLDRGDDLRAVQAASIALRPGGLFVLDLFNGAIARSGLVKEECQLGGGVRFTVQRRMEGDAILKNITVDDQGCSHHFMERVHAWTVGEVRAMLETAGLRVEEITDGPDPVPFDPAVSERIVAWARKEERPASIA